MLTQLIVKNLAIVSELELNFSDGLHIITGETGAGKSIIMDALSIALGERASPDLIRATHTQAEVIASFEVNKLPRVQAILRAQELPEEECVIRRIISSDGRSRTYINGQSVALQQIKQLAPHLVHIHSQHQHHALLDSDYQRQLLDEYAEHPQLLAKVNDLYQKWHSTKQQIQELTEAQQHADRLELLSYQVQELENLQLQHNELNELSQKHTQLAKAEELLSTCHTVAGIISESNDPATSTVIEQLHSAVHQLSDLLKIAPKLTTCNDLLQQAIILVTEANTELQNYCNNLELDPAQLNTVEQRLSAIHAVARKLKIAPEFLGEHHQALVKQRDQLLHATERLQQLQQELDKIAAQYQIAADQLHASRLVAGQKLSKEVIKRLKNLEMQNAVFSIVSEPIKHSNPTPNGNETIQFFVTTNPGQPAGALKKIASGGELSRISLAIQVITAQKMATPTLIMDEVDVGISGKTAATVGSLMRELAANAQILCITHLPQVAAQGHWHFKVEKHQTKQETTTNITPLSKQQRIAEIARLLGGINITAEALAHAEKLIETI